MSKSDARRIFVWNMTGGICWYCGCQCDPFKNFTIDHVVPISRGGGEELENLVPCCKSCNSKKHGRGIEWLRTHIERDGVYFSDQQVAWLEKYGIKMPRVREHRFWFEKQGLG